MPSIFDMLAEAAANDAASKGSGHSILPEAAIERLREALPRYTRQNPFKVGDLVTPIVDGDLKGAGEPHLVVETFDPICHFGEPGSNTSRPVDMRVICINRHGDICGYYVENAVFETYTATSD